MPQVTITIHYNGEEPNKHITEPYWYIDNTDIYDSIFDAMGWVRPNPSVISQSHRSFGIPGTFGSTVDAYHKAIKIQAPDVLRIDYYLDSNQSNRKVIYTSK